MRWRGVLGAFGYAASGFMLRVAARIDSGSVKVGGWSSGRSVESSREVIARHHGLRGKINREPPKPLSEAQHLVLYHVGYTPVWMCTSSVLLKHTCSNYRKVPVCIGRSLVVVLLAMSFPVNLPPRQPPHRLLWDLEEWGGMLGCMQAASCKGRALFLAPRDEFDQRGGQGRILFLVSLGMQKSTFPHLSASAAC